MTLDRLDGVDRTGRGVATEADVEGVGNPTQPALVEADAGEQETGKWRVTAHGLNVGVEAAAVDLGAGRATH
jgi:hypothetical protein